VHEKLAIKAGVSPSTTEAIREDREPECLPGDERMVYGAVREILDHKALTPGTFHLLLDALGMEQLVELVTAVGFYAMLCGVLNVFQIPAHEQ
jgi:4-carboxymuconolactone decarboxylase